MSELIHEARKRKDLLKHMILQLHEGEAPDAVRPQLVQLLGKIPYHEVVAVEQELIEEGLPSEEVIRLCDAHSQALRGAISQTGAKPVPAGHPVDAFKRENRALEWELASLRKLCTEAEEGAEAPKELLEKIQQHVHALTDIEKHYLRKENLLFPFLEKHGITGPPKVMWGKHDQVRELLKAALEVFRTAEEIGMEELKSLAELVFEPLAGSVEEMILKEEEILLPMCMDTLDEREWHQIYVQSPEVGFCLIDPEEQWEPALDVTAQPEDAAETAPERVRLPTGSLTAGQLDAILSSIPFDLTFVDAEDTVRYFTQGRERIFERNRAILGRKVQLCHPPQSVHIVQQILDDFRAGRQTRAPFWINLKGRFIHIEYFALRDKDGNYLGTLEVSQDLTEKRSLQGEQRLLSYEKEEV